MDRLSIFLTLVTGSVLVGGLVTAVLALGYYTWVAISVAAGVGLVLTWPAAYAISRVIKRNDPNWPRRRSARDDRSGRRTDFPET